MKLLTLMISRYSAVFSFRWFLSFLNKNSEFLKYNILKSLSKFLRKKKILVTFLFTLFWKIVNKFCMLNIMQFSMEFAWKFLAKLLLFSTQYVIAKLHANLLLNYHKIARILACHIDAKIRDVLNYVLNCTSGFADSIKFIESELAPNYANVVINFVPFGKSDVSNV